MILTPHILAGAVIGAKTQNLGLIIILGIISHFILDKFSHWEYINYGIRNFRKNKSFKSLFFDLFKITIDGLVGLLIVFLIVWQNHLLNNWSFILFGIFFSILPDILLGLMWILVSPTLSEKYMKFHHSFLHGPKDKEKEGKITFLGLITQILVIIISIIILFS